MATVLRVNRARVELELAKRGWAQQQLAALVGTSQPNISRWLSGLYENPRLAAKVAQAFGIPVEDLLSDDPAA